MPRAHAVVLEMRMGHFGRICLPQVGVFVDGAGGDMASMERIERAVKALPLAIGINYTASLSFDADLQVHRKQGVEYINIICASCCSRDAWLEVGIGGIGEPLTLNP